MKKLVGDVLRFLLKFALFFLVVGLIMGILLAYEAHAAQPPCARTTSAVPATLSEFTTTVCGSDTAPAPRYWARAGSSRSPLLDRTFGTATGSRMRSEVRSSWIDSSRIEVRQAWPPRTRQRSS